MSDNKIDVPRLIAQLDAANAAGQEGEGERLLENALQSARKLGDWQGELTILSELLGQYRRSGSAEKGLAAVDAAQSLIRAHAMENTVSGATVLLNAATTLKCFGRAERSMEIFPQVLRVYAAKLDESDYRMAGLYNNMALSYEDMKEYGEAEKYFALAMKVLERCPNGENELAVTLCNLAEVYDKINAEDERIGQCMERSWEYLNTPSLPRDGYHAFTIDKCASAFDYFGYFIYAGELRRRAKEIYGRT